MASRVSTRSTVANNDIQLTDGQDPRAERQDNRVADGPDNRADITDPIPDGNKDIAQALLTKYKPVDQLSFKKVGNERKYKELHSILVPLLSVLDGSATSQASALQTCVDLLVSGLKNVLIADSFKRGWAVIDEANHGPMFDSPEEERIYRKADKRLGEQQQAKRAFSGPSTQSARFQPYGRPAAIPSLLGRRFDPPSHSGPGCYRCGQIGHKYQECPNNRQSNFRRF